MVRIHADAIMPLQGNSPKTSLKKEGKETT